MKRLFNQFVSLIEIALQRTWAARGSHAAIALGVLVVVVALVGGPNGGLLSQRR